MKLLNNIINEKIEQMTRDRFLLLMKEKFPYGKGTRFDFGDQEDFRDRVIVNVHCKKHGVDFTAKPENLKRGTLGADGCPGCKQDIIDARSKGNKSSFYDKAMEMWKDVNGKPLYIYNAPGLRRYTTSDAEFDFYCPKIGRDGKPHGKQTRIAQAHIYGKHPEGCRDCKYEQGYNITGEHSNVSREEFIKRVKANIEKYGIPTEWYDWEALQYTNTSSKAVLRCKKHDMVVPNESKSKRLYLNNPLCPECQRVAILEKEFKDKLKKHYSDRFVLLSQYVNRDAPIILGCTLHGKKPFPIKLENSRNIFHQEKNLGQLVRCPECERTQSLRNYKVEFKEKHGDKYSYPDIDKEFVNSKTKIPIECHVKDINGNEHGIFWQSPAQHAKPRGCPVCQESRNEIHIKNILQQAGIKFITQKTFPELKGKPFDFYLPDYNVLIEYDGEQHFRPVFGKSEYTRQITYNNTYESDSQKNTFATTNKYGIGLIRIPYILREGEYDQMLLNSLKTIEKNVINYVGEYPEREEMKTPPEHPKQLKLKEGKLTLKNVLFESIVDLNMSNKK